MTESTAQPTDATLRRVVLVRHTKAAADSGGSDRARELTGRGRSDAAAMGAWLAPRLASIDAVWSSSAVRAAQTFEAIAAHLTGAPPAQLRDDLYDAGPDDLLEMLRAVDDGTRVLLVVGHNPTIERVQAWLTEDDRGFPTGATAIVEFAGSWADLEPGDARLVDFGVP